MNTINAGIVLAQLILAETGWADPLDTWTWGNPLPTGINLSAITYGNGRFVAAGRSGIDTEGFTTLTSADGINWARHSAELRSDLLAIAYGNGQFLAVGGSHRTATTLEESVILSSADGVTWLQRQPSTTNVLRGIAYGDGRFVAVGWYGTIVTSADGTNWVRRESGTQNVFSAIAYGNGQFVAVGQSILSGTAVSTSPEGVNWVEHHSGNRGSFSSIAYGNGRFVVARRLAVDKFRFATSVDGVNWTQADKSSEILVTSAAITYGNGQFVAACSYGNILNSVDGINWVRRQTGTRSWFHAIAYGDGKFVAVGEEGHILRSGSIITLAISANVHDGLLSLSLKGPIGLVYNIQTSTDLISWRDVTKIAGVQSGTVVLDGFPTAGERRFYRAYAP